MQLRTYLGFLGAVIVVVAVSFLTTLNRELLGQRLHLTSQATIPVYLGFLLVFLVGFLPPVTVLLVRSLQRDLTLRRQRRRDREVESLGNRFRRAVDYQADGQWQKAAAELEVLLSETPEDFASLLRYGEVLRLQGRTDEALEVHRRASVLYPHSVALLYQLAEDYEERRELQVAREIRNRILRDFPGQGLQVLRRRRDRALVERDWQAASRFQGRIDAIVAETGGSAALAHEAGVTRGLAYQQGVASLEEDRAEEAAATFRRLLEEEPRFVPAAIMLGEAELLLGREEAALAAWRRGYGSTRSPVFLQRVEDHFIEAGEPARAIEAVRGVIAEGGDDLRPRFLLGRLYYRLEMHDEALKVLAGLAERMDASPTFHYLLGRIHQRRHDPRAAAAAFEVCLERLGVLQESYVCQACGERYGDWQDRCSACGVWNSVDLDLPEESLSPEELGVFERPVWGGYGGLGEAEPEAPTKA